MLYILLLLASTFLLVLGNNWYGYLPPSGYDRRYQTPYNERRYQSPYYEPYCAQTQCTGSPSQGQIGQIGLDCSGFQDPNSLRYAIQRYANPRLDFCTVQIRNSRMYSLAPGTFRNMNVRNLRISDNYMRSLGPQCGYYRNCYPILDGLQRSLTGFYFTNNTGVTELDMTELMPMENLKMVNVRLNRGSKLKNPAYVLKYPLERLDLEDTLMGSLAVAQTYGNPALNQVVLRNLGMDRIRREDFPNPASNLTYINLSENLLTSIPPNLLVGMPSLTTLDLSNNRLRSLPENTFRPVANTLQSLYVYGNPIRCDCSLNWILRRNTNATSENGQRRVSAYLVCEEPAALQGRALDTLDYSDLCLNRSNSG